MNLASILFLITQKNRGSILIEDIFESRLGPISGCSDFNTAYDPNKFHHQYDYHNSVDHYKWSKVCDLIDNLSPFSMGERLPGLSNNRAQDPFTSNGVNDIVICDLYSKDKVFINKAEKINMNFDYGNSSKPIDLGVFLNKYFLSLDITKYQYYVYLLNSGMLNYILSNLVPHDIRISSYKEDYSKFITESSYRRMSSAYAGKQAISTKTLDLLDRDFWFVMQNMYDPKVLLENPNLLKITQLVSADLENKLVIDGYRTRIRSGSLNDFSSKFCTKIGFRLFEANSPDLIKRIKEKIHSLSKLFSTNSQYDLDNAKLESLLTSYVRISEGEWKNIICDKEFKKLHIDLRTQYFCAAISSGLLDKDVIKVIKSEKSSNLLYSVASCFHQNRKLYDRDKDIYLELSNIKNDAINLVCSYSCPIDILMFFSRGNNSVIMKMIEKRIQLNNCN